MVPKGIPNKKYTEFKQAVVERMLEEKSSYAETERIYGITGHSVIPAWERIYLEEGSEGFRLERRGRVRKGRPRKALKPEAEEDLPAEKTQAVQELRQKHKLEILLTIAQLPRAAFYCHLKQMKGPDKYETAKAEITAIYHENKGRYGYRRTTMELNRRGTRLNHKLVCLEKSCICPPFLICAAEIWSVIRFQTDPFSLWQPPCWTRLLRTCRMETI